MPSPTRADLEASAKAWFEWRLQQESGVRELDDDRYDGIVAETLSACQQRTVDLSRQFGMNRFDERVTIDAERIARGAGANLPDLDVDTQLYAHQLAARAEMELLRFIQHVHLKPGEPFAQTPIRGVLGGPPVSASSRLGPNWQPPVASVSQGPPSGPGPTLEIAVARFLKRKKDEGVRLSHQAELSRALNWLVTAIGGDRPFNEITRAEMVKFRDDIQDLDVRFRGKSEPFANRQTTNPLHRIKPQTAARYWASILAFSKFTTAEEQLERDPAAGLTTFRPVHQDVRKPKPFTNDEVQKLLSAPLYAGHLSPHYVMAPGVCKDRGSYWWSGLLMLYTGMRAGEVAQLEVTDFHFDGPIPYLWVTLEGATGSKAKKLKTAASVRQIPLSPVLISLGIEAFVASRAKGIGAPRVFPDVSLGAGDRKSDGLTKFWGRFLRNHGLWNPGRGTHVFRHTLVANLRASEVPEDLIGPVTGHKGLGETKEYGGDSVPLGPKARTIAKIDFGFDVVAKLTGSSAPVDGGAVPLFNASETSPENQGG